jgi:hypothetical protein
MTKRTKIVYVYLALFAFVLGFSFTLASRAQAVVPCCVVEWCDAEELIPAVQGHEVPIYIGTECRYTGTHSCDMSFICAEPPQ